MKISQSRKLQVRLATQVFSDSLADAIKFRYKNLKVKQFEGHKDTVKFIRL